MTSQDYYAIMRRELNEKQWRHFVALEALKIGHGGINQVMAQTGVAWQTIKKGIEEIEAGEVYQPGERIRRPGGGKKRLTAHTPDIEAHVEQTADPKGDPERAIRWTSLSMDRIASTLNEQGYQISPMSVYRILKAKGFALKANKKTIEGNGNHPDRDAQFEHINQMGQAMGQQGAAILSVDCKKTELIGNFKNNGREWVAKGMDTAVNVYDFGEKDKDGNRVKAIPYGIYDVLKKQGFVNVGIDHNTAAFAVESITRYWESYGKHTYPEAQEILILADGGSSNGSTNKLWKVSLQKLANQTGLTIHVCHYPPGTSKWNAIEHQLFSFIAINWRAKPLLSYAVMLELLNHTTTQSGLKVTAVLDDNRYETGRKITHEEMDALNIERDLFHGDWNYTIAPQRIP